MVYFGLLGLDSTVSNDLSDLFARVSEELVPGLRSYKFVFDRLDFHHAVEELRINPTELDVYHYLYSLLGFFDRVASAPNLCLPNRDIDFKKRAAEDFGVGLASLLVVRTFALPWHAITQLPAAGFQRRRPDFVAQLAEGPLVFETKGTTNANQLVRNLRRGKDQAREFRAPNATRLSFSSHIPCAGDIVPPQVLCADPPFDLTESVTTAFELRIQLLLIRLLEFSGLDATSREAKTIIATQVRGGKPPRKEKDPVAVFHEEAPHSAVLDLSGTRFIGRRISLPGFPTVRLFLGARQDILEYLLSGRQPEWPQDVLLEDVGHRATASLFSDGSVLALEMEDEAMFLGVAATLKKMAIQSHRTG